MSLTTGVYSAWSTADLKAREQDLNSKLEDVTGRLRAQEVLAANLDADKKRIDYDINKADLALDEMREDLNRRV